MFLLTQITEYLQSSLHGTEVSEGTEWSVQNMGLWIQDEALKCAGSRSKSQENYLYAVWYEVGVCAHTQDD